MNEPERLTETTDAQAGNAEGASTRSKPERIGRYRVLKVLGEGGFGTVYLAHDDELRRAVAIKVPRRCQVSRPEDVEMYMTEARVVARLDHPGIVPVYDVGRTDDGLCYVVSKFVEGSNLAARLKQSRLSHADSAEMVATVAEVLHHAHLHGLVHRDVKPSNILLDTTGQPYVADFGLALSEEDFGKRAAAAGTPAYMSPEQAWGEAHRVDGRADVFSLGVVMYELLVGRRPFRGNVEGELLQQITSGEVRPLRQRDDTIPKELERICLKALAKRVSDRYMTALDFAEDLRHFLGQVSGTERGAGKTAAIPVSAALSFETPAGPHDVTKTAPTLPHGDSADAIKIVPKGLRSFDAEDADFFLELLPGPRDRRGLPESIRFWKTLIEQSDPDKTFAVGLIYGPSGCGKTSLVKSGLLPRLGDSITSVYVEATTADTEARLLRGLRRCFPQLPDEIGLADTLTMLRRGDVVATGKKVLLVLDQFEHWLHAERTEEGTELVQALRQCEGRRVQCIVMVRDDFWMAVTRFMRELEIQLLDGQNSAAVDLFGPRHARHVLAAFGRAFGALPKTAGELNEEHKAFLHQAISGLAREGKVICVRLALFAEMMKEKAWVPATLKEVGGTEGIGVMFLEETFSAATAPPEHRLHQAAARSVLNALLPEGGSDIKGNMRSYGELLHVSGYRRRPKDFEGLLDILDTELRLVTPTDPDALDAQHHAASPDNSQGRYFQLTHDYLVPSLQEWLTRKQRETHRGRAELCLAERAPAWGLHRRNGDLPSWWEFMAIRLYTSRSQWSAFQKTMMRKATGYYLTRTLAVLLLIFVVGWGVREAYTRTKVEGLISSLVAAETTDVPEILVELEPYRRRAVSRLRGPQLVSRRSSKAALHMDLARLHFGTLPPEGLARLRRTLLAAPPDEARVIASQLGPVAPEMSESSWAVLAESAVHREILATATVLARHFPEDRRWKSHAALVSESLMTANSVHAPGWIENLAPVGRKLVGSLRAFFSEAVSAPPGETQSQYVSHQRHIAAAALARYLCDDPKEVSSLLVMHASDVHEFQSLIEPLYTDVAASAEHVRKQLDSATAAGESRQDGDEDAVPEERGLSDTVRAANAIVALMCLEDQSQLLRSKLRCSEDRTLRSRLLHRMAKLGVPLEVVAGALASETHPEVRAALLLSLGDYPRPAIRRKLFPAVGQQVRLSLQAPDSGEHAAAVWLARRWEIPIRSAGTAKLDLHERNWYEGPDEHWLAIIRDRLDHDFAIAAQEVTIRQYEQFNPDYRETYTLGLERFLVQDVPGDCPAIFVSVYDAMQYCNWLSSQEGVLAEQLCYEELADGTLRPKRDYLRMEGYRLPTQEEWVMACQADAASAFSFGDALDLLRAYAWYYGNTRSDGQNRGQRVGQLKPNALGMSDMYGNVWEWTTDFDGDHWSLLCGGSCDNDPCDLLVVGRINKQNPESREHRIGFRISRTLPDQRALP